MLATKKNRLVALLAASLIVGFTACVKSTFDEPTPGPVNVTLVPNTTIKELKALHVTSGGYDLVPAGKVIKGTVVMDDRSGNFYKELAIQDETGGIEVLFNDGYLYTKYPVGSTLYIDCGGLYLSDYGGLISIGGGFYTENGVKNGYGITADQARVQVEGDWAKSTPAPKTVNISQLNADLVSTLIRVDDVEFLKADTAQTWGDIVAKASVNRTASDCPKNKLIVRTSGYATFAAQKTPQGKGSLVGVLTKYKADYQLILRDLNDVIDMTHDRCGTLIGGGTLIDISAVRNTFQGSLTHAPTNSKIHGVVISDRTSGTTNGQNVVIQDGTAGILVRFDAVHSFNPGDELEIVTSDQELSEYKKLLEVNNVPLGNATVISTGKTVTPRLTTLASLTTNAEAWESTLVKIVNCSFTNTSGTLSGSTTLNDGSGTMVLYTAPTSTISGTTLPSGQKSVTAMVSDFTSGKQLILRTAADIQ